MDFVLALALLILTLPLTLAALLLVRASSRGSPLYFQRRLGLHGRTILICKIRTMYLDCERESGAVWSRPADPRVTWIGRLLRRLHVDELPQLVSVLRGDMSLVGPRPERPEIVAEIERALPHYRRRLDIRPGLTGLAQVLQAPDTDLGDVRRKLGLDLSYLGRSCLALDLKILLATPFHIACFPSRLIARFLGVPLDALGQESRRPPGGRGDALASDQHYASNESAE